MPTAVRADEQPDIIIVDETGMDAINDVVDSVVGDAGENVSNAFDYIGGISNVFLRRLLFFIYKVYRVLKVWSIQIVSLSLLIGILIQVFCRRNKKVRRSAIIVFLITIPVIVLLIVFGFGTLISYLMYGNSFSAVPRGEEYNIAYDMYAGEGVRFSSFMVGENNAVALLVLIFFSIAFGIGKFLLGKYIPSQRRLGIYGFCIAIPAGLLFMVFCGAMLP